MRDLSATLEAAQKKPDRLPYVEAKVYDFDQGIKRLSWERLYTGSEPDNHHGIAFDGQGSMHRIRAAADNKLYRQKITSPDDQSDYSQWTQIATDCQGPCAIAAYGAKVYIFYRDTSNCITITYSHDYGQSWETIGGGGGGGLAGYSYRKQVSITFSTAGLQTDYQMKVIVHKGTGTDGSPTPNDVYLNNHCQDDFDDIRFTKGDGQTLLDQWREAYTSGSIATYWVEAHKAGSSLTTEDSGTDNKVIVSDDSIFAVNDYVIILDDDHPQGQVNKITAINTETNELTFEDNFSVNYTTAANAKVCHGAYLYYKNDSAELKSVGADTFPFFEDFLGDALDTDKWDTVGSPTIVVSGGTITITSAANGYIKSKTYTASRPMALRTRFKSIDYDSKHYPAQFGFDLFHSPAADGAVAHAAATTNKYSLLCVDGVGITGGAMEDEDWAWHIWDIIWLADKCQLYSDGTQKCGDVTTNIPATAEPVAIGARYVFSTYHVQSETDWILARKYVPGLTWGAWGNEEEMQQGAGISYPNVLSMAASWWGTGNNVVCFALRAGSINGIVIDTTDQTATEHTWLGSVNHPFANTFGIGASYTPDHVDIVIAALEAGDPYNLYGLYRQQFDNTYTFSDVDPFITAPDGEGVTYEYPDCHNPVSAADYENTQLTAVEKYTGITAYTLPLTCHAVKGSAFSSMAFTEPKPFINVTSHYGLRITSNDSYWWLERPDGVWRAPRAAGDPQDLTPNILSLRLSSLSLRAERGNLVIELDNSKAQYATPPAKRSEVVLKLGYKTSQGNEAVEVGRYWIDSWEYSSSPNASHITLYCLDGQELASRWSARFQMRWPATKRVWEIIQEIICRWGINLTSPGGIPKSSAVDNLYPDFTLQPGTRGDAALRRILSFIPDALIFDGNEAYVKDLRADEANSYSYGTTHVILQGEYSEAVPLTRARAIGRAEDESRIVEDAFDWTNLQLGIDILAQDYDPNLQSAARAQERADAILRRESLRAEGGQITIPVNCGQELYDVITVTDKRCGISSKKYRVMDIETALSIRQWQYQQRLTVGAP